MYHTDAREYHCTLGRFVQVDPLGLAAGPNVYAYCNDSPADTVDPSGLEPDWAKAATGIMMVALSAMQTQAAISLGGSVFGMLGVTAGYGGFAAGMAMIVSAFSPDPRLDQVAETGAMIQLVASAPAFGASVIAAGRSMLRRGGAILNGVRSFNPTVSGRLGITVTNERLAHVTARHLPGGAEAAGKSVFNAGESVPALVRAAESVPPVPQAVGSNFQRVVNAGRVIGVDRATRQAASVYTVITDSAGNMVTMFPGLPAR
ncbi:MAG: hypothetical protein IMZ44_04515 [Planctomycetes bacterium]|nr:hypothetical protein [Planctomycetota bacterium]